MKKYYIIFLCICVSISCISCSSSTPKEPEQKVAVSAKSNKQVTENKISLPLNPAPQPLGEPAPSIPELQPVPEPIVITPPVVSTPALSVEKTVTDPQTNISVTKTFTQPQTVASSNAIVLVFSTNDRIDKTEHDQILEAVEAKWFAGKEYIVVKESDYIPENYVGRVVIAAEARSDYGEYTLTIRSSKIVMDDGVAVEEPCEGPEVSIDHRTSVDNLIREFKYVK
ncbi:MAG: hypothetical protein KBC30_08745 [Planctomycetes bacterium]|jgi:hypothetical protein|nr:hypothetical protein [Planctomycetota bacterium]HPY75706.1 hypothetical protein [Planctomycetota bacterium]HQB01255.1 hypothetical protein [Planctomycetota bacterium]